MIKTTDYIAQFLAQQGVKHVFGLTGGAVVHFFDSVSKTPGMNVVFNHHEQAAAFAAQAYARVAEGLGACFVTTGPGGTNAITGLCAAWLDSIPCIYISGQARLAHTTQNKPIRQLGTQQLDIIALVAPVTKYAVMITDVKRIRYELEKAVYLAQTGRPGPVWIDVPLDFQWAMIDPDHLPGFDPKEFKKVVADQQVLEKQIGECVRYLNEAKRPLVLAGHGVRLGHAGEEFRRFIEVFAIPFVTSWNASDLLATDHPLYAGRPGLFGQRGANLAVQNCDLLLALGSHLCIPLTGTMFEAFAREAKIIMVDTDPDELKTRTVRVDLAVECDVKSFLKEITRHTGDQNPPTPDHDSWRQQCQRYQTTYNAIPAEWFQQKEYVNPYVFVDALSDALGSEDVIVVDGGGTINQITFQSFKVKEGQRLIISAGLCSMGSGLPESVGACFASGGKRTICLCGDGSMQLNIQELQTIMHHRLPVKIFIFNNEGYLSIRQTQQGFLEGRYIGSSAEGGLSLPDFKKVAQAYGIEALQVTQHGELKEKIQRVLRHSGPVVCEVLVEKNQEVAPRQGFEKLPTGVYRPRPLEDMDPLLDRWEFAENMIVKPLGEAG